MREQLEIHNFGGLNDAIIELNPKITILTGPQASGKSITAKLFYFFKRSFVWMEQFNLQRSRYKSYHSFLESKFCGYFPRECWGEGDFSIKYSYASASIKAERKNNTFTISYGSVLQKAEELYEKNYINSIEIRSLDNSLLLPQERASGNLENYYKGISPVLFHSNYFVVAGRSFFSILQNNIFSLLSSGSYQIDPIITEFGAFYEKVKQIGILYEESDFNSTIRQLRSRILRGKHVVKNRVDYLEHEDKRMVELSRASSGQQEALPLAILLSFFGNYSGENGITIYIEEPEAHLFPSSQKSIAELIALVANRKDIRIQFVITTHSPYIPASFNNLILAGEVFTEKPEKEKEIEKIVTKGCALNYEEVSAYSMSEGSAQSIMDEETRLISTSMLDEISNEISIEFGELLDL